MKFKLLFLAFLIFAGGLTAGTVRNFKAQDINFQSVSFNDLKGEKFTIVDFWATWCKPCIQAIPKLSEIYGMYKDKGVQVIGINVDSPRNSAKVKPFVKAYKIDYTVLRDPSSEIASDLNVTSYPTLYIGFRPGDESILKNELEKLLNEKTNN